MLEDDKQLFDWLIGYFPMNRAHNSTAGAKKVDLY